jgi:hypothetical protein
MPGQQTEAVFNLHVPLSPQSRAGRHPLKLRVTSEIDPSQFVEVKLTLTVAVYAQFRAEMQPQRLRAGQVGRLTIFNQGNSAETFTIQFTDPAGELAFQPPKLQLTIPNGQTATTEYRAQEGRTRLMGGEKSHSFGAQVSLPKGEPQTLQGEMLSRGFVPTWIPPMLLLLCCSFTFLVSTYARPLLFPAPTQAWTSTLTLTPELTFTPVMTSTSAATEVSAMTNTPIPPSSTTQDQALTSQALSLTNQALTNQAPTLTSQPPPPPPIAKALADKRGGMAPLTIKFLGNSSEGVITTFAWIFGDGPNSNETSPTHVFTRSSIYGTQLKVSGAGGNDEAVLPIVVAPQSSEPLSLSVWLTSSDFDDFDVNVDDWTNTFPPGSEIFFRDMTELIIPYIKNEAPLAAGDPDVLYLSSETMLRLDELFFQGYRIYTPLSGDQPPELAIFAFSHLTPIMDENLISYPVDRTKFAQRDGVVYGIPYHNGYLAPVASERNNSRFTQAFFFSMWLHVKQDQR